jgi:hypothetical protein
MDTPQPIHQKLSGEAEIEAALDRLLSRAQRRLCVFDRQLNRSFVNAVRSDLLRSFLLGNRNNRVRIVLHDASTLARDCPRLLGLLRQFSHAIAIQETEAQAKGAYDPFIIGDDRDLLHRFHYDDARGLLALDDAQATLPFTQRFEELWVASTPAVFATTLGL